MSGPFGSSQWMYSSGAAAFYDFPIEQSLKFNDDDSSYLSWTPASTGNRKTWTYSVWAKVAKQDSYGMLLECSDGSGNNEVTIGIDGLNKLVFYSYIGGYQLALLSSANLIRDPSAWYNFVFVADTTQSTASERARVYINGERLTSFSTETYPSQNYDTYLNFAQIHSIGRNRQIGRYFDGYMAEANFIDGQALDPTSFGEFKSGVWIPKDPSGLTYGTNGFRLSFQNDTVSEGFNTVLYNGTGADQSINGLGFSPDFVWIKSRTSGSRWHALFDSVRGTEKRLFSNATDAESTTADTLTSFDADGFTLGSQNGQNASGDNFVAWCWDAGSGSAASNTSGSITSTVKANAAYGFSVITYTGNGTNGATVGHGLSSAPDLWITKNRSSGTADWLIKTSSMASNEWLRFKTDALLTTLTGNSANSSVITTGGNTVDNASGNNYVTYAFRSVANYSSVGSYSGNGSTTGPTITTGFKPAFVMIKRTDTTGQWFIFDDVRSTTNTRNKELYPNASTAEATYDKIDFLDTGFQLRTTGADNNASGGTYIYLAFADTRDNAFWRDQSGNGNDWQPNNLTYQDSLPDSTTNNFATMNAVNKDGDVVLSEGNLKVSSGSAGTDNVFGTFAIPSSGKWYFEAKVGAVSAGFPVVGIGQTGSSLTDYSPTYGAAIRPYGGDGNKPYTVIDNTDLLDKINDTALSSSSILQFVVDADNGNMWFGVDGTYYGLSGGSTVTVSTTDIANGTNPAYTLTSGIEYMPYASVTSGANCTINFGQDDTFAGAAAAGGNTDANGLGSFAFVLPDNYLALCTANLPDPVIDPAKDDVPADYMNTILFSGDGTTSRSITGVGFQPDFVWMKRRNENRNHTLGNAVVGATKYLSSNTTDAEITSGWSSFDSDGFTLNSSGPAWNASGGSYVAWNWKAGNGTSSNTSGSITSTVSVNQKAGFSIVKWAGDATNATIGHGLGAAPSWVLVKRYDRSGDAWRSYHEPLGPTKFLEIFNTDAAQTSAVGAWNDTAPTSSVFTIGSGLNNGGDIIAYCFAEVEGYSKFGSFGSTNSTDGPFVYCGFRPALVIYKTTDYAANWEMIDATRNPYNVGNARLFPSSSSAESTAETSLDLLSNGFKVRDNYGGLNLSGNHIFLAFAEMPFRYSNAR